MGGRPDADSEERLRLAVAEHDVLRLRVRVEQLEHELEAARAENVFRAALLDATYRSRVWRALAPVRQVARLHRPDVVVAVAAGAVRPWVTRIPLAGMHGAGAARWTDEIVVDGVALPGVLADPPSSLQYRVIPRTDLRVRAFAGLRLGAAVGNRGGVRFAITVRNSTGAEVAHTERVLDPAGLPDDRRWHALELHLGGLPATEHTLILSTELPDGADGEYAWAVWGDPVLLCMPGSGPAEPTPSRREAAKAEARALGAKIARRGGAAQAVFKRLDLPRPPATEHPVISLLVPVHDPDPALFERTIASVRAQTSPRWQLCLSDDGSRDPGVRAVIDKAAEDPRVVVTRSEQAGGISAATNAALALAAGEYVAPLDHDDTLAPDAIARVGARLVSEPSLDALYTDNDKTLDGGARFAAAFKPAWSPEFLEACMYTLHLGVYRRELVEQIGAWRSAFDGAQDHDLVLRLADHGARIGHLPGVLYHWGVHPGSAAQGELAKPEAYQRGREAIEDHLRRTDRPAEVVALRIPGRFRVVARRDPGLAVDLIVPVTDELPGSVVEALADDPREGVRVMVVPRVGSRLPPDLPEGVRVLPAADGPWGELAGAGLAATDAPLVVLFEELAWPVSDGWLDELAGLVRTPGVGAAGGLVVDEDDTVVHAGVALPRGVPLPVHPGANPDAGDAPPELTMVTNRSAASGVVALRRDALVAAGGVPADLDRLALTATTLAVGQAGWRVALTPHARLRVGSRARANVIAIDELRKVAIGQGAQLDPFYNPNFWPDRAAHIVPLAIQRDALHSRAPAVVS